MTPIDLKSAFIFLLTTLSALQNVTSQLPTNTPTYIAIDCDTDSGNYTLSSTYHQNLNLLLSNLTAKASDTSFYNSSVGPTNTAYGQFYCRGDISTQLCGACVEQAATNVTSAGTKCFGVKAGKVWYEECTLIYDDKSNVGILEISDTDPDWSYIGGNVSDSTTFEKVLEDSFGTLIARAADTSSSKGFATKDANVTKYVTVYCLVQCSPDLTGQQCESCLNAELNYLVTNYSGHYREEMLMFYQNCQLRYSTLEPFYLVSPDLAPTPTPTVSSAPPVTPSSSSPPDASPSEKDAKHNVTRIVVPVVIGSILLICGVCLGIWFCLSRSTSQIQHRTPRDVIKREDSEIGSIECFSFAAMEEATMKFSHDNKLGEGGFGIVYKGMHPNGKPVAIKRLSKHSSSQGIREFKTEVAVVAKLQHRNLVRLLGYCDEHEEQILVYEYLPNLSLDKYLFDATMSIKLDWKARYKIIEGVASGLRYLHIDSLLTIIHRDLKPSNILLDEDMNPKIADFGMVKLVRIDETMGNTSRVVGTYGYMPPEYAMKGRFSTKSDVYSFGVIMLEILSGKSSNHFYDPENDYGLHHHAWKIWNDKAIEKLVDPTLQGNYSITEAERYLQIGLLCVQDDAEKRPTIRVVMSMLENPFFELPSPSVPSSFHSSLAMSTVSTISEGGETQSSISSRV